jgi:glucan-binding YG repeat protein
MRRFSLYISFYLSLFVILVGCTSSSEKVDASSRICPECHMHLKDSNINTATIKKDGKKVYFDDIGCMVLYTNKQHIELKKVDAEVFTNDTHKYLDAQKARYTIDENTPMHYGFGAYEKEKNSTIIFDEMVLRMLRGENMANPKIRKQILGY